MAAGVVLDTTFLITLANDERAHHSAARLFWRHFTESGMPIFLSTVVVSEFCIKQELPPDILRSCFLLPFNWDDAQQTAELLRQAVFGSSEAREAVKDDWKIIAQSIICNAAYLITEDDKMHRRATAMSDDRGSALRSIDLKNGFNLSVFHPARQGALVFESPEDEADEEVGGN